MMKAMIYKEYGAPQSVLTLQDQAMPQVGKGEVLIEVHGASVNAADWHLVRADPFVIRLVYGLLRPKNPIPGGDVAGIVVAVGEGVHRFKVGDGVFGHGQGTFAEYVSLPADQLVKKPENVGFEEAATIPLAAYTALQGLRNYGEIKKDQRVLIVGASGGVGSFAVQIAKAYGAHVTAVCHQRNMHWVEELGADALIDYTAGDYVESHLNAFDLIFELAGETAPKTYCRMLKEEGILVQSSGAGAFAGIDRILKGLFLGPFITQEIRSFNATCRRDDLETLRGMLEAGTLRPVIDRRYSLDQVPEAIGYLEAGHTQGKVVITF